MGGARDSHSGRLGSRPRAGQGLADRRGRLRGFAEALRRRRAPAGRGRAAAGTRPRGGSRGPARRFLSAVARALEYIAAGDVYQANLSREWAGVASEALDPLALFRRLRRSNPSPYAALLRAGEFAIASSSPERLVSIRGDLISTRPIAGTRPRGASPAADQALISTLLSNEKERAEHVMLIDLERNDLGRVCVGGSVEVDEYMGIETYAHVHHIVSNVRGIRRPGVTPVEVLRAMFPGGTITGCPKLRCMQIIAELRAAGAAPTPVRSAI